MVEGTRNRGARRIWLTSSLASVSGHVVLFTCLRGLPVAPPPPRPPVAVRIQAPESPPEAKRPPAPPPADAAPPPARPSERRPPKTRMARKVPEAPPTPETPPPPETRPAPEQPPPPAGAAPTAFARGGLAETGVGVGPAPMVASSTRAAAGLTARPAAPASPPSRGDPSGDLRAYYAGVFAALSAGRRYPAAARRLGLEGRALVAVKIDRAGRLVAPPRIVESTTHEILDAEAVILVEKRAPFPAVPPTYPGRELEMTVPIRFSLND